MKASSFIVRSSILSLALSASSALADPVLTTLATFNNINGANPQAGLLADKFWNLYGTTSHGGASNYGTVFEIAANSHQLSTLATFDGTNGANPYTGLIANAAGNLYGTTRDRVFELAAGSHNLSTLVAFNGTNGAFANADLIADTAGNMYGTTQIGGASNYGTVFEIAAVSHGLSTLATFNNSNGANPYAGLIVDAAGNRYGTTARIVFKVAAGSRNLSTSASFNGARPGGSLLADAAGNL